MLPFVNKENHGRAQEIKLRFDEKVSELAGLLGVEYRKGVDLVALLWPVIEDEVGSGGTEEERRILSGGLKDLYLQRLRSERSRRAGRAGMVFIFGGDGTYFGLYVRGADEGGVKWQGVSVEPKQVPNWKGIAIAREGGGIPLVVELGGSESEYDLVWRPNLRADYKERWRVDLLSELGRAQRLTVVEAVLGWVKAVGE